MSYKQPDVTAQLFKTPFARGTFRNAHWALIDGKPFVFKLYPGQGGGLQKSSDALTEVRMSVRMPHAIGESIFLLLRLGNSSTTNPRSVLELCLPDRLYM